MFDIQSIYIRSQIVIPSVHFKVYKARLLISHDFDCTYAKKWVLQEPFTLHPARVPALNPAEHR